MVDILPIQRSASINQSINQPINQPINHSVSQSINIVLLLLTMFAITTVLWGFRNRGKFSNAFILTFSILLKYVAMA